MDIQNKLIEKINDGFLIAFANHLFDNYVKIGDYYHLKGEVYWNTSRKSIDELLIDYKEEYKEIENIKKIDISFTSIFKDNEIKEEFAKEGLKRASQNNFNQSEVRYNAKWFKRGALFGHQKAIKEFIQSPEQIKINKKCKCKRATFTRTVDADFNCLCGKCGHPI